MKKSILFLMLCFISTAVSYSQNIDPSPLPGINFDDTTVFSPRQQQKFVLGWQWAGPSKAVNKRLHINTYQSHFSL